MTLLVSGGMGNFSTRTVSKSSDSAVKLATLTGLVLALLLAQNLSLFSMSQALITSQSTPVTVASNLYPTGPNSCVNDGLWLLSYAHKQSLPSIALKAFMKLHYKGRQTCMITIIYYYDDQIMPTAIPQL